MKKVFYTVYLKKTDEIVAIGDAEQCRNQLGKPSVSAFYSMVSKNKLGKHNNYVVLSELMNSSDLDENPDSDDNHVGLI